MLRHALNFEDFKQKAQALHIQIDEKHQSKDYGRVINYQLMDFPQKRSVRDYTLNKKNRSYSLEKIMERLKENHEEGVYCVEEINQAFQKEQKQKAQEPDLEL
ncbi:hypothetical protein ACN9TB_00940 [Lactococcus lactis]